MTDYLKNFLDNDCISIINEYVEDYCNADFEEIRVELIDYLYYQNHNTEIEINLFDNTFYIKNFNGWEGFNEEELLSDICYTCKVAITAPTLKDYFGEWFNQGDDPIRTIDMFDSSIKTNQNLTNIIFNEYDAFNDNDFENLIYYIAGQEYLD